MFPLFPWLGWIPTVPWEMTSPKWLSKEEGLQALCMCTQPTVCDLLSPRWASQHVIQYRAQFLRAFHSQLWPWLITGFVELIHCPGVGTYVIHDMDSVMDLWTCMWRRHLWNNAHGHSRWMPEQNNVYSLTGSLCHHYRLGSNILLTI